MKSWIVCRGASTMNDQLTRYTPISGISLLGTTEAPAEIPVRVAGTFSRPTVYVSANSHTTATAAITLRKNLAATGLVLEIAPGTTGLFDEVDTSVSFAATDEVDFEYATPNNAGTTSATTQYTTIQFEPTDNTKTVTLMAARGAISFILDSTTAYMVPAGWNDSTDVEANRVFRIRTPGTASNLWVHISANARTSTTTFRTRKNSANGGQSVDFTSSTTGSIEDTSNSDSLAVGDDFNYSVTTGSGSSEAITIQMISTSFLSAVGEFMVIQAGSLGVAFGTTTYLAVGGRALANTTEANVQARPDFGFWAKDLAALAVTNTLSNTGDIIALRVAGVTTALDLRFNASTAGLVVNSNVAERQFLAGTGDLVNIRADTSGSGSGTITFAWISLVGVVPKGPIFQRRSTQQALLVR